SARPSAFSSRRRCKEAACLPPSGPPGPVRLSAGSIDSTRGGRLEAGSDGSYHASGIVTPAEGEALIFRSYPLAEPMIRATAVIRLSVTCFGDVASSHLIVRRVAPSGSQPFFSSCPLLCGATLAISFDCLALCP